MENPHFHRLLSIVARLSSMKQPAISAEVMELVGREKLDLNCRWGSPIHE